MGHTILFQKDRMGIGITKGEIRMKQEYVKIRFNEKTLQVIWKANQIIEEYQAKGFSLTLRQLYYQFVARDLIPNKSREYDKLGSVINNARLDRHRAGNGAKLLKAANIAGINYQLVRSEERRVGKECRSRWSPYH